MTQFAALIRTHTPELAAIITAEQGKTLADSRGDVFRGLEVVDTAGHAVVSTLGCYAENVATDVDTYSVRQPLGVAAGICPFNFPAMIPLWMFPLAIACGNAFVLKPSERVPGAAMLLAELAGRAGVPPGVLNVVHGGRATVDALCDAPGIASLSFVGGDAAGAHVARRAAATGKRAQVNMGAKNHAVIMPDAPPEATAAALAGAAFGAAGQRCMALSVAIFVGDCSKTIDALAAHARALRVGAGDAADTDVGPLISVAAADRARTLIASALSDGARAVVDGRAVSGLADGLRREGFVGPTLLTGVSAASAAYRQEIFAPVLLCMQAASLDDALRIVNGSAYGNGAAVFTRDGGVARRFARLVQAGQVGINVPIPVAAPFGFSFSGWGASFAGDLHFYGAEGVEFFTKTKTVTQRWKADGEAAQPGRAQTAMPTSKD
jgi:malonate-semialdehyde dehydrogenase (acetylating)/methylmalonate-semialdehyde dehydrogenase